ncbi:MAG: penicillin-binding transpeptidase domain-containing protein, partial [Actinomycetes bacterium]
VSARLQQAAATALGTKVGSVVAIDPRTGGILAMYSNPTFDPNLLALHSQQQVMTNYQGLIHAAGNPLSPSAYRNRTFPGSTFKMITSAAVFDHAPNLATKNYPVNSSLTLPNTNKPLHNFAGENCGGQLLALFTVSCNTGFGAIGLDLGGQNLSAEATSFGFDQTPPIDLPAAAQSTFPAPSAFAQNQPGLAYSAIGQEDVQATPLEMAMVAAAMADGGTIMTPHILDHVTDSQAKTVSTYQPKPWLQATSSDTAKQMTTLMEAVVNAPKGTGGAVKIPGVTIAAKTGTAQTGTGLIDAWFAAFAPVPNPTIAVAVLVPNQPSGDQYQGGTIAAPIAKQVIQAMRSAPRPPPSPPPPGP